MERILSLGRSEYDASPLHRPTDKLWIGVRRSRFFPQGDGVIRLGPECTSADGLQAVVNKLKADLDAIIREATKRM